MNSRGAPFQFMSIDPAKRQAELEKRFGLPKSSEKKMHLDLGNSSLTGMRKESGSASNSPRLQHRVPMFVDGMDEPAQSTVDANPTNVDAGQKPRVRVVPIEVETADSTKRRARAFSRDPYSRGHGLNNTRSRDPWFDTYEPKQEAVPSMGGPRVCNIPIKVERASPNSKSRCAAQKAPVKKEPEVKTIPVQKEETPKPTLVNGCNGSKQSHQPPKQDQSPLPHEKSLKKIAVVLEKLQGYQAEVEKFSGTSKEKQYRYLDEMLTRLMLDLDNVETMGNEDVRLKRKDAIKKVQHCVDMLESKVCDNNQTSSSPDVPQEMSVEACSEEAVPTTVPEVDEETQVSDVPILPEVEMKEVDQPKLANDSEKQTKVVEAEQTMETETLASQLEVNEETASPKKEGTEVLHDIEISEVVDSDINPHEVITSDPIVEDVNDSCETVVNSTGEYAVEKSEMQVTEVTADSKQSMEVDDVENEKTLDETVNELDQCVSVKSVPDNIPNTEMDNHCMENNTNSEIVSESNLSPLNS